MLLRRIQRRMGLNRIAAIDDYCQYLRDTPPEIKALAKDLLIGVTEFFREPEAWAVLEEEVLPHLVAAKHPEAPLRVWVTGCATGEEAYSIGMGLLERVANSERNGKLQIFATDIDSHALEIARAGIYPESIASSIAPERLTPFFTRADNSYRVKKELREAVVFAPQNLIADASSRASTSSSAAICSSISSPSCSTRSSHCFILPSTGTAIYSWASPRPSAGNRACSSRSRRSGGSTGAADRSGTGRRTFRSCRRPYPASARAGRGHARPGPATMGS